jgi:hypothetical protein
MTENEKIYFAPLQDIITIRYQPFPIRTKELVLGMPCEGAASSAEVICQPDADGGWNESEKPSTCRVTEYLF